DTVTAHLTASEIGREGQRELVYTVTLRDADGNPVAANNDVTVTTTLGIVTIPAGSSSGTLAVPVQGDDVYIDPSQMVNAITGISEANAGTPGSFENLNFNNTPVRTAIEDTLDTVT